MRFVGIFFLLTLIATIAGTTVPLTYDSLPPPLAAHATKIFGTAFLVVGILLGLIVRGSMLTRVGCLGVLLASAAAQGLYLWWFYGQLESFGGRYVGPTGTLLPFVWAGIEFLGSLVLGVTRKREFDPTEYQPTENDARQFIHMHDLMLTPEELKELAEGPRGLVCRICRRPYTGKEGVDTSWKERWVRCPRVRDHVFHARDFEAAEWRCPMDKSLLYKPPGRR